MCFYLVPPATFLKSIPEQLLQPVQNYLNLGVMVNHQNRENFRKHATVWLMVYISAKAEKIKLYCLPFFFTALDKLQARTEMSQWRLGQKFSGWNP